MFFKKNLLWILLFGTLIGLNETLIGSFSIPYRSVILSSITLALLSIARFKIPQMGTSILIMMIAVLFKINNSGFHSCTMNVFLCGPTALLMLGLCYEIFASIFVGKRTFKYLNVALICIVTSIIAFSLFALMNTFILKAWDTSRLIQYITVKASLTAVTSSALSILALYLIRVLKNYNPVKINMYAINSLLGCVIIALWLFGSFVKL